MSVARPIGDRIVVKPDEAQQMSPGGIALPNEAQDHPIRGKVVAVGSGSMLADGTRAEMEVAEGDIVVFGPHSGVPVEAGGIELLVMYENEVLLVV